MTLRTVRMVPRVPDKGHEEDVECASSESVMRLCRVYSMFASLIAQGSRVLTLKIKVTAFSGRIQISFDPKDNVG